MTAATQPRCADCRRFIETKKAKTEQLRREVEEMARVEAALLEWEREFPGLCDGSEVG